MTLDAIHEFLAKSAAVFAIAWVLAFAGWGVARLAGSVGSISDNDAATIITITLSAR